MRVNASLDRRIERRLNIDTVCLPAGATQATERSSLFRDSEEYHTLPYWLVRRLLKPLTVDASDVMSTSAVVWDVGSAGTPRSRSRSPSASS